jgi:hypothetical protein
VDSLENRIFNQRIQTRLEVSEFINGIRSGRQARSGEIMGDIFSADEIIKLFNQSSVNIDKNLILILPDVRLLKDDLTKLSRVSENTTIFLASKDYGVENFENRTIEKFKELGINLDKYNNIKVKILDLSKEELEEALIDTFSTNDIQNNNKLYIKANKYK